MASCDLVVVQRDLTFALTEVRIGVAAAIISVPILRRASGSRLAAAFLTGEPFDAAFARDVGLVTHVTDDVAGTVAALCDGIRMGAPRPSPRRSACCARCPALERDEAFERMRALSDELFAGPDAAEGMAAFAEKRPPAWQPPFCPSRSARSGRSRRTERMAASMSSSETSTRRAASPSGMNESAAATRRIGAVNALGDEAGDDGLADAARPPGLVDDDDPADGAGVAGDLLDRQRRQPAQVEHAAADARRPPGARRRAATGTARWPTSRRARRRRRGRRPASRSARARGPTDRARRTAPSTARHPDRADRGCGRGRSARGTRSPCRR